MSPQSKNKTRRKTSRSAKWQERDPQFARESRRYAEPIPSRELILEELRRVEKALDTDALAKRFSLRKPALIRALDNRLNAMVRVGELRSDGRSRYSVARDLGALDGRVSAHRDGYGWFTPDDGSGDVYVDTRQMAGVMHGDRLRVRLIEDDGRGRRSGAVLEVLERGTLELAGRFEDAGDVGYVVPDNPRLRDRVLIPGEARGEAQHGDLVVARIVEAPTRTGAAVGQILRVLDARRAADLAAELAIVTHSLPVNWPREADREARGWGTIVRDGDIANRVDLRALPIVTIDGEDARDFDDAVYCEPLRRGWRLIVAIADVSHYVAQGGALDIEAQNRATSVYFPDRVLPMLPEALSNELCSLKPQVDRLVLACDMRVNEDGEIGKGHFSAAVIHSAARLTYTQVAAMLLGGDSQVEQAYGHLMSHLRNLHQLYQALRQARERRGALDFDAPEVKVRIAPDGTVAALDVHARNDAHRLIEECMIAANIEAARFLKRHRLPTLYRVHGEPETRKVSELQRMLRALGVGVRFPEQIGTRELRQVTALIAGRPDAAFIESLLIRSLPQAVYQPTNIGHFGLGLSEYAHFTSPIRRYPDLLVHRAIRHALAGGAHANFGYSTGAVEQLGRDCSARERRADEASRDVLAYLKCDFMRAHVGDEFEAVISGVVEFGLFVQLANLQVDGLVHVSALHGDYFVFDAARCAWTGRRTHRTYRLGMHVSVRLTRVDMRERRLDFEIATDTITTTGRSQPPATSRSRRRGH
jgi:ribonuclease R